MIIINKANSKKSVDSTLKVLRQEDKKHGVLLRKVYTHIIEKEYTTVPTTSDELLAIYTGKEDITGLDATALLMSIEFTTTEDEQPATEQVSNTATEPTIVEPIDYDSMCPAQLTSILLSDLGSEVASEVVNMTTGLKVKLDMLDELKDLMRTNFSDIRPELLTARLANALALTKEAKGSSLHTSNGNLSVYEFLNSDKKLDSRNYMFMADIEADATASLDILILEAALRSYKAQVALGALPVPPKELILAVSKTINGIVEVTKDNKEKVAGMTF